MVILGSTIDECQKGDDSVYWNICNAVKPSSKVHMYCGRQDEIHDCDYQGTASYQLREKKTGLSRESTLSLSRNTGCKETPVFRPPYDLGYFARSWRQAV
jgi:hypothetical protein